MPPCSLRTLLLLAVAYRLAVVVLLELAGRLLPLFDSSPDAFLVRTSLLQPFVRWDVLWFLPVALRGAYETEQETAFGWGWIGTMRALGKLVRWARAGRGELLGAADVVLGGLLGSWAAGIAATGLLFALTRRLTHSATFAWTTTALYILSPSPAALVSPYTEPLYACLTFAGMLAVLAVFSPAYGLTRRGALLACATAAFAGSTAVRPTGLLNAGYLVWYLVVAPWLSGDRRPLKTIARLGVAAALSCAVAAPFVYAQTSFYGQFCSGTPLTELESPPAWCASRLPLLYTHVQKTYWGVGFFAYWEFKQIPNFAIAAPVYGLLAVHHSTYLRAVLPSTTPRLGRPSTCPADKVGRGKPYLAPALLPFVLHSVAVTLLLLFNSHVQIVLRLAQTNPTFFWAAAALMERPALPWKAAFRRRKSTPGEVAPPQEDKEWDALRVPGVRDAGPWYLWWVVVWGCVTTVLWAGFFPPA